MNVSSMGPAHVAAGQRLLQEWLTGTLQFGSDDKQSDAEHAREAVKNWVLNGEIPSGNVFAFLAWGLAVNLAPNADLEWPMSVPEFGRSGRPSKIRELFEPNNFHALQSLFCGEFLEWTRQCFNPSSEDRNVSDGTSTPAAPRGKRALRIVIGLLLLAALIGGISVIAMNTGGKPVGGTETTEKTEKDEKKESGDSGGNNVVALLTPADNTKKAGEAEIPNPVPVLPKKLDPGEQLKADLDVKTMAFIKLKDKGCVFGGEEVATYAGDLKTPAVQSTANLLAFLDARYGSIVPSAERRDEWMLFRRIVANATPADWTKNAKACLKAREIWIGLGRDPSDPSKAKGKAAYDNWDAQLQAASKLIEDSTDADLKNPLLK